MPMRILVSNSPRPWSVNITGAQGNTVLQSKTEVGDVHTEYLNMR